MAESNTTRFGLRRWGDDSDTFDRTELDGSLANIEARGAIYLEGLRSARPAAGVGGRFYTVKGDSAVLNGLQFYDDGSTWRTVASNIEEATARSATTGGVALTLQMLSGQTGNAINVRSSTGTVVGSWDKDGNVTVRDVVARRLSSNTDASVQGTTTTSTLAVANDASVGGVASAAELVTPGAARLDGTRRNSIKAAGTSRLDSIISPGFLMLSASNLVPAGWLACDGSAVSRTTYADLFDAVGTTFGGGNGTTTFNLPDYRDRMVIGSGPSFPLGFQDGFALGARGGSFSHQHAHTVDVSINASGSHAHTIPAASMGTADNTSTGGGSKRLTGGETHDHGGATGQGGVHTHGVSAASGLSPTQPHARGAAVVLIRT